MTDNEISIAIAEACGWVWYRLPSVSEGRRYKCLFLPGLHEYEGQSPEWLVRADGSESICNMEFMSREGLVQDYRNDLNAMHEAEKRLGDIQRGQYEDELTMRTDNAIYATADQRAEAFLRTIGKWDQ